MLKNRKRKRRKFIGRRTPGEAVFGIELRVPKRTARAARESAEAVAAYHQAMREQAARRCGRTRARQH